MPELLWSSNLKVNTKTGGVYLATCTSNLKYCSGFRNEFSHEELNACSVRESYLWWDAGLSIHMYAIFPKKWIWCHAITGELL